MRGYRGRHLSEDPLEVVKRTTKLLKPDSQVLDLAVGEGRHTLYLAEKGFEVTGVDIEDKNFESIKNQTEEDWQLKLIKEDILKFETEERYDLVICSGLLHFFTDQQVEQIIKKMKRLTKPGGYNILAARMDQNPRGSLSHLFTPEEMKEYYQDWQIVEYEEVEKQEFPPRRVQVVLSKKGK